MFFNDYMGGIVPTRFSFLLKYFRFDTKGISWINSEQQLWVGWTTNNPSTFYKRLISKVAKVQKYVLPIPEMKKEVRSDNTPQDFQSRDGDSDVIIPKRTHDIPRL